MVPYTRNQHFTGRDNVLKKLRKNLLQNSTAALTQPQVISGLGGIGKTQTAVEYAYRHHKDYNAVFWVRADSTLEISRGFVEIAKVLNLSQANAQDEEEAVQAAKRWLDTNANWLLIFDNADEPELLKLFVPWNVKGHIFVTSRAQNFQDLGVSNHIEIQVLLPEDALKFLLERTGHNSEKNSDENTAALELAEELGYLPLALEQAAAYIVTQKARFQDYLTSYRKLKLKRLEKEKPRFGNYPESVATTWLLNFIQVEKISKASADLLRFSAFLDSNAIPFELIILGVSQLGEILEQALEGVLEDPLIFNELLTPLRKYSLIQFDQNTWTYNIHRLVQEVIKSEMKSTIQHDWLERSIKAVNRAFPDPEVEYWPLCERLLSHIIVLANFELVDSCPLTEVGQLFNVTGAYLLKRGQYSAATIFFLRSLSIMEKQLAPDDLAIATNLNNLAVIYKIQGLYTKAELHYKRALSIWEQQVGPDHPNVAASLSNFAVFYNTQGRNVEAESLLVRALSILEQQADPDYSSIATNLNNLAEIYRSQGHNAKAELLLAQSLSIKKQQLGADHPAVAISLNNLAELYRSQGRYSEAEILYVQSLEIRKGQLGADHPDVAASLNNLAALYEFQGRYSESEPLFVQSLQISEIKLGRQHPTTSGIRLNLVNFYEQMSEQFKLLGRHDKVIEVLEKVIALRSYN
jgi:tetratricopeptide (TPR) repeat protein